MEQEEVFAVIGFNNRETTKFPKEINDYLAKGYTIKSIQISDQSSGTNAIAFVVLTK